MRVAIASDHAGFALKQVIVRLLGEWGVPTDDLGTTSEASVDYPDFAAAVSRAVLDGRADRGILVCGTGIGMSIAANKLHGIRAALVCDALTARLSRQHNDANVMAIGGRTTPADRVAPIVRAFLDTAFDGGRHQVRLEKVSHLESSPDPSRTERS